MTTRYDTKEQALETGLYYAGYKSQKEMDAELKKAKVGQLTLGWPHSMPATDNHPAIEKILDVFYVNNINGIKVGLGVSKFRDGYDLWLVNPETGFCQRT
jgi:hypothetical protein